MRRVPTSSRQGVKVVIMPQVQFYFWINGIKMVFLAQRVSFDIYAVCTHTSISQVEVNESVPRMNFLEFLASLGGVLGLMLGLGVLQLVQLADQFVQNFLEKATSRNLEKSQPTIFCV